MPRQTWLFLSHFRRSKSRADLLMVSRIKPGRVILFEFALGTLINHDMLHLIPLQYLYLLGLLHEARHVDRTLYFRHHRLLHRRLDLLDREHLEFLYFFQVRLLVHYRRDGTGGILRLLYQIIYLFTSGYFQWVHDLLRSWSRIHRFRCLRSIVDAHSLHSLRRDYLLELLLLRHVIIYLDMASLWLFLWIDLLLLNLILLIILHQQIVNVRRPKWQRLLTRLIACFLVFILRVNLQQLGALLLLDAQVKATRFIIQGCDYATLYHLGRLREGETAGSGGVHHLSGDLAVGGRHLGVQLFDQGRGIQFHFLATDRKVFNHVVRILHVGHMVWRLVVLRSADYSLLWRFGQVVEIVVQV